MTPASFASFSKPTAAIVAIEGNKPLLHLDTHTNPECGIGINIQYSLQEYYDAVVTSLATYAPAYSH